jgi:hypothetical protein
MPDAPGIARGVAGIARGQRWGATGKPGKPGQHPWASPGFELGQNF